MARLGLTNLVLFARSPLIPAYGSAKSGEPIQSSMACYRRLRPPWWASRRHARLGPNVPHLFMLILTTRHELVCCLRPRLVQGERDCPLCRTAPEISRLSDRVVSQKCLRPLMSCWPNHL